MRKSASISWFSIVCALGGCSAERDEIVLGDPVEAVDTDVADAPLVIDGEITDTMSFPSETIGTYTLARVRVLRTVQGRPDGSEQVVEVRGGRFGDTLREASAYPTLLPGERARFYLEPAFWADAEAVSLDPRARAWAGQQAVYGVRRGVHGKVALSGSARPDDGIGVTQQALQGCGPNDGWCFNLADIPYSFAGKSYQYHVNPNTTDTGGVISAVQMGFAAWEAEPSSRVDFAYMGTTTKKGASDDGMNVVSWVTTLPSDFNAVTSTYKRAPTINGPWRIVGFDTEFNDNVKWGVFTDTLIERTAMHESGHALGFDDLDTDETQIMFGVYRPTLRLGSGDRAGVRTVYQAPHVSLVGDFDGDQRDDILTFENLVTQNGNAWVALNEGSRFGEAKIWANNAYLPGSQPLVGRFTNDEKDDIAFVFPLGATAAIAVCPSLGNRFGTCSFWHGNFPDTNTLRVGDVDGNGKDDIVGFVQGVTGQVYVARSTGSTFGVAETWVSAWMALGADIPEVADVDADGDDDMIVFGNGASNDIVIVGRSNRTAFEPAQVWSATFCFSDQKPLVGDFNGDRRADIMCVTGDGTTSNKLALPQGGFGTGLASSPRISNWRNATVLFGRFPAGGSIVRFDHCDGADVFVYPKPTGSTTWGTPVKWHEFFGPGPCP
jgi:hypothetical protein